MPALDMKVDSIRLADGRVLAYSELGEPDGLPVVWNHGGLSSRIDAAFGAGGLAGIRLIAIDRPGIGRSSRLPRRRVVDWPADVRELVDQLTIDTFAVAGWSAGGPYALALAAAFPDRVVAAATVGGMAPLRSAADVKELGLRSDRILYRLALRAPWLAALTFKMSARRPPAKLRATLEKALPAPDRRVLASMSDDEVTGYFYEAVADGVDGTVDDYRAFEGAWGFELASVPGRVRCWQGDGDTFVPRKHAERLAAALPQGEVRVVPDAGHFLLVTHAAEVFDALRADAP